MSKITDKTLQAAQATKLWLTPNSYPFFETNVIPGTDWEISQYGPNEFYGYRLSDGRLAHVVDSDGWDALFTTREKALEACQSVEEASTCV